MTKQAANPDRHGMSDTLNRYIDSLLADGKRNVIDERNQAVTDLTGKWNRNVSDLVGRRNSEIETLKSNMPASQTSFTTDAGLTAGGTPKPPPKAQSTPTPNHKPAEQKTEGLVGRLSALLRSAQ